MSEVNTHLIHLKGNQKLKFLKRVILVIAAIYLFLCVVAFLLQDRIIFSKQKLSQELSATLASSDNIENVELTMKDGLKLRGWLLKNAQDTKSPLLIYFGANAEEVSNLIPKMSTFKKLVRSANKL